MAQANPGQQSLDFSGAASREFVSEASASPSIKVLAAPTSITEPVTWTVSSVRRALDEHETGTFATSATLATAFDRDDRIAPCIGDRINALVGAGAAEFSLQPSEERHTARSKAFIKKLDWWHTTVTNPWLSSVLRDGIKLGFHLSRIPWERTKRAWIPRKPIRWNPEHVWWSEHEGVFMANTTTGPVPILPGDPNWFFYAPGGDQTWMSGAVRGLAMPYIFRQFDYKDWARFNERHGLPIIVLKEPSGTGEKGKKGSFYQGVKQMGSSGILRIPQGKDEYTSYGADLLEPKARSWDSFDKFADRLNVAIAIYTKGQNLTTEVDAGAYASTGWHMRVRKDYAENDADAAGEALRSQLLVPYGRFNEPSWDDEIACWPTWDLEIPEDQQQLSDGLLKASEAITNLLTARVPVDWDQLLPRLGIPLLKGQKMPVSNPDDGGDGDGDGADPQNDANA